MTTNTITKFRELEPTTIFEFDHSDLPLCHGLERGPWEKRHGLEYRKYLGDGEFMTCRVGDINTYVKIIQRPNNNCLTGIQCPKCGSLGPFDIEMTTTLTTHDSGTDEHGDTHWDDQSKIECNERDCGHSGVVHEFK